MTDEWERPGTSGPEPEEPSLAALFGFDPADEQAEDVSDGDAAMLRQLFADTVEDEPEGGPTPLAVIAAATREQRAVDERVNRERAQRRGRVLKGVLIAAAVAAVVVVLPVALRGGSSSNSAGTAVDALATSAAAETSEAASAPAAAEAATSSAAASAGSEFDTASQAGGGASAETGSAASSAEESSAAASSSASGKGAESEAAGSENAPVPSAETRSAGSGGGGDDGANGHAPGSDSAASTSAAASGSVPSTGSCEWPELPQEAIDAALDVLGWPQGSEVGPVVAACTPGRVGAVLIPSANVTILVTSGSSAPATATDARTVTLSSSEGGLTVVVLEPTSPDYDEPLSPTTRKDLAEAVLAALR